MNLLLPPVHNLPHYQHPPPNQSGAFVTTEEPTLKPHNHPEPIVYINVHSCCSTALDKCIMTCIHHYSIMQSSFTALIILCAPPFKTILKVLLVYKEVIM